MLTAKERLTLHQYLAKAKSQNLDIKIEVSKSDAAEAKAFGLIIPPPMVGISQMKEDTGEVAKGLEVSQMLPFPTKILSDKSARNYEAKSQNEMRLAREQEILAYAKLKYFSLWAAQEKLELLREKKSILEKHIQLSRSGARSDSFAGVHVLKTESDRDLLETEVLSFEQTLRERQADAGTFINIDIAEGAEIVAEEPPVSELPKDFSINDSHQIKAAVLSLEGFSARKTEALSAWLPDLNIRFKQVGATTMNTGYKEVMLGVTLPFLFFWDPIATNRKAGAEKIQAEYELEKQKRGIEAEKVVLLSKAKSLKNQIEVLTTKLIPKAEKRVRLVHNLAPRDMETLEDHREAMEALPDLKMKALDLRFEYEEVLASLEKYFVNQAKPANDRGSAHE